MIASCSFLKPGEATMVKLQVQVTVELFRCGFCGRTYTDEKTLIAHGCENEHPEPKYLIGQKVFVMRKDPDTKEYLKQEGTVARHIAPVDRYNMDLSKAPEATTHFYGVQNGSALSAAVRMNLSGASFHRWFYEIEIEKDVIWGNQTRLWPPEDSIHPLED